MGDQDDPVSENGDTLQYSCPVCRKELSRKQRLASHLVSCHDIRPNQSPVKYKTYVNNPSIPVPRTTQYRQRKRQQDTPRVEVSKFLRQYSETLSTTCDDCLDFDLGNEDPSTSFQSASAHVQQRVLNENANQIETQQLYEIIPDTSSNTLSLVEETLDNCHAKFKDNIEEGTDSLNGCNVQPEIDSLSLSSNSSLESDSSTECLDNNYDSSSTDSDLEDNVADNYDDKDKTSKLSEFDEKCMTLLSFVLKHHLSWQASIDFIELFGIFMTDKEITLDKIKQRVGATKPQIIDFCEHCYTLFPEDEGVVVCLQENCGGLRFKGHITRQSEKKNRKSYFACLPLKMQIQDILERDGVWDSICNYRKKCQEATSVTDILNGEMYKLISGPGNILESDNYITLLFNTDGVPLYKSSGISIWPVHLVINELPPKIRFSRKNMILWGVWQAKGKPNFQTFFQPFIAQMISLKNEGIQVKLNDTETQIRAVLLAGTLDLQAKAIVAKMTQHNGQHGCITCEEPGEVVKQGKGHCRVYPFRETFVTTRTSSGVLQNGLQAMANRNRKTTTKGIKDVSCLHGMDWFDLIYGLVPDYMHGALLGVTKQMLQLLFASSNSKKPFFIGNHIKEVDDILKKMQPTDNISRLPRHLEKNLHHLKASELELWLLYYSLPCLIDFLKPAYLNHLALMIEGIYILLGDNIDATKLNRAERVLSEFYHLFSDLYGYENCTLNLHNVGKHLIEYVRKLGPVWAWSCFPFEDMNGSILEYAHGTGDVFIQILWTIQAQKRLAIDAPSIRNDLLRNYVLKMVKAGRNVKAKFEAKNCRIAGGMKPLLLCQEMTENLKAALNISEDEEVGELSKALRIIIKDTIFFTKQYSRMKKRIAHTVLIRDNEVVIATIQYFIYHKNSKMCFAVVNKLEMNENPLLHPLVNHFICLKSEENQNEEMSIIPVDKIREKLLVLNGNKNYRCVCRLPNLYQLSV